MNQPPPPLHLRALATDFDGTLAHNGTVSEATLRALERWKRAGHKLVLVTGRELNDLAAIFPELGWFDLAVMEKWRGAFSPLHPDDGAMADPLPKGCERGDNQDAFRGALRLRPGADMLAEPLATTWRIKRKANGKSAK